LTPVIFFPRVVAPLAAGPCRFDGLAVDAPGTGLGFLADGLPDPVAERVVNPLPEPRATPLMEVVANRALGREVMRHGPPPAAGTQDVEGGIQDGAEGGGPRPSGGDLAGQHWCDDGPLFISQIAGIRLASGNVHEEALRELGCDRQTDPEITQTTLACLDDQNFRVGS